MTVLVVAAILAMLLSGLFAGAALLQLGLKWAKAYEPKFKQALKAVFFLVCFNFFVEIVTRVWLIPGSGGAAIYIQLAGGCFIALFGLWLVSSMFVISWRKSFQAWLPCLLVPIASVVLMSFVLKPHVMETYLNPSNTMAPTLLGQHFERPCEECSEASYTTVFPFRSRSGTRDWMCRNFHVTEAEIGKEKEQQCDRFLVIKCLEPQRWDVVAFKSHENPGENHLARLVGMPGETVWIKDGFLIVDGNQLDMPAHLDGINYVSEMEFLDQEFWGTEENPAKLGVGEYFLLCDFSRRSIDSRLWTKSVPGHPSYAVPESNVIGVVTHIYWPIARWQAFR